MFSVNRYVERFQPRPSTLERYCHQYYQWKSYKRTNDVHAFCIFVLRICGMKVACIEMYWNLFYMAFQSPVAFVMQQTKFVTFCRDEALAAAVSLSRLDVKICKSVCTVENTDG